MVVFAQNVENTYSRVQFVNKLSVEHVHGAHCVDMVSVINFRDTFIVQFNASSENLFLLSLFRWASRSYDAMVSNSRSVPNRMWLCMQASQNLVLDAYDMGKLYTYQSLQAFKLLNLFSSNHYNSQIHKFDIKITAISVFKKVPRGNTPLSASASTHTLSLQALSVST